MMTEEEALRMIHGLPRFHGGAGLERIRRLLRYLDNPQKRLRFIHVAGTNGKGSTCAMTASILQAAGYRTGLYISPYILNFRERMQVNGTMIPPETLGRLAERLRPEVNAMTAENGAPAEFELVTAIAMEWFAEMKCDVVVLEVGLGGRLDATNAIDTPLASVICTIDLDHTELLGHTREAIAVEKCGIIKPGGRTVCYPQPASVRAVIEQIARDRHNRFIMADPTEARVHSVSLNGTEMTFRGAAYHLPLLGMHQVCNAVTVLTMLDLLRQEGRLILSDEALQRGLAETTFPARLEIMGHHPTVLLDGAHNPSGVAALCAAVRQYLNGGPRIAVIGMLRDKDYADAIQPLIGLFSNMITLTPDSPRALDAATLAQTIRERGGRAVPYYDASAAIEEAKRMAGSDGSVTVCGSLYLAAQLRPLLKL